MKLEIFYNISTINVPISNTHVMFIVPRPRLEVWSFDPDESDHMRQRTWSTDLFCLSAINNAVFGPCQLEIFYWEINIPVTVSVFCGKLNSLLVGDATIDYKC